MTTRYQTRAGVGEQQVGGERMLLDEATNRVHVLNGTAAFIWDSLKTPLTAAEIEERLAAEYDLAGVADVQATIRRVLGDFLGKGLVRQIGVDSSPGSPRLH
jgi:hypothetical protein